ncbi:hypothetical protein GGH92_009105, partial [Coemansia sp. RSA 2673]
RRTPAWCDRVLFRGGSGQLQLRHQASAASDMQPSSTWLAPEQQQQQQRPSGDYDSQGQVSPLIYQRLETRQSDHRPIIAAFRVRVKSIDREARQRVLAEVRANAESKLLSDTMTFAKILWLSAYTESTTRAAEVLAACRGDLSAAIQSLYPS